MLKIYTTLMFCFLLGTANGQVGFGATASNDLYQRYANPSDVVASRSAGSALLNFGVGPKIWVGGQNFSVSLEAQANLGLLAFSMQDYKGLGALGIPIMAKFNFAGLSTFNKDGRLGMSVGGGIQYFRTELYGLKPDYSGKGVTREYIRTYVVQLGYGFGLSGFSAQAFVRYGFDPDTDASALNVGIQYDFNLPMLKKIADPASAL